MDINAEMAIRNELEPGESLLWSGKPGQGVIFHALDIFIIPYMFFMCKAILEDFSRSIEVIDSFSAFHFLSLMGFLIGLYYLFGRFLADILRRKNTFYGLTNDRIIIFSGILSKRVKSIRVHSLTEITFDEKKDGKGTIYFGKTNLFSYWRASFTLPGIFSPQVPSFEDIEYVRDIYGLIREAQRGRRQIDMLKDLI